MPVRLGLPSGISAFLRRSGWPQEDEEPLNQSAQLPPADPLWAGEAEPWRRWGMVTCAGGGLMD